MRKAFVVICAMMLMAALFCGTAFGQVDEAQQYLEPERSILTYRSHSDDVKAVRSAFEKGYDDNVVLRMVRFPAFDNHYYELIGLTKSGEEYGVILLRSKKLTDKGRVYVLPPSEEYTSEIDSDSAKLIVTLWTDMILQTRYSKKPRWGHDGVMYFFSMFIIRRGDVGGQIWSPDKDTNTGMLVEIGERLADYAQAEPDKRPAILAEIRSNAEELKKRLAEDEAEEKQ